MFGFFPEVVQTANQAAAKLLDDGYKYFVPNANDSGRDFWEFYLSHFSEEIRQGFNCNSCRKFVSNYGTGAFVKLTPTGVDVKSFWDFQVTLFDLEDTQRWNNLINSMREYWLTLPWKSPNSETFSPYAVKLPKTQPNFSFQGNLCYGTPQNLASAGEIPRFWHHFHITSPKIVQITSEKTGQVQTNASVILRMLNSLSDELIESIRSNLSQFRRNAEITPWLNTIVPYYNTFKQLTADEKIWMSILLTFERGVIPGVFRECFLVQIEKGKSFDQSLALYNSAVAPESYRRATTAPTQRNLQAARQALEAEGVAPLFNRKVPTLSSILETYFEHLDYVLLPEVKGDDLLSNVMSQVVTKAPAKKVSPETFQNLPTLSVSELIAQAPKDLQLLFTANSQSKLFALTCPSNPEQAPDKKLLKWDNQIGWAYSGGYAGEVERRVKNRGGVVNAKMCISIIWDTGCDYDLHVVFQNPSSSLKQIVYFGNKRITNAAGWPLLQLDVDSGVRGPEKDAAENVYSNHLADGEYTCKVNNYTSRRTGVPGMNVRFLFNGEVKHFFFPNHIPSGKFQPLFTFKIVDGNLSDFQFDSGLTVVGIDQQGSAPIWGLIPGNYYPIRAISKSPNYWGQSTEFPQGNLHYFLYLDDILFSPETRLTPWFSEFIHPNLYNHRKVLEQIASACAIEEFPSAPAAGIGLSENASVVIKVDGRLFRLTT